MSNAITQASETFWLLTVDYDYDDESDEQMMCHQSLHRTKDVALLRLFDVIHANTGATPQQATVVGHSTREDGAEFGDVDAVNDVISYSVVPLMVDERAS